MSPSEFDTKMQCRFCDRCFEADISTKNPKWVGKNTDILRYHLKIKFPITARQDRLPLCGICSQSASDIISLHEKIQVLRGDLKDLVYKAKKLINGSWKNEDGILRHKSKSGNSSANPNLSECADEDEPLKFAGHKLKQPVRLIFSSSSDSESDVHMSTSESEFKSGRDPGVKECRVSIVPMNVEEVEVHIKEEVLETFQSDVSDQGQGDVENEIQDSCQDRDDASDSFNRKSKKKYKTKALCQEFICDQCGKVYAKKKSFQKHLRSHDMKVPCDVCGKPNSWRARQRHWWTHLNQDELDREAAAGKFPPSTKNPHNEPVPCPHCGKHVRRYCLPQHEKLHFQTDRPFACSKCPKTFKSRGNLKLHDDRGHSVIDPTRYQCPSCPKAFGKESWLRQHERNVHSGRPYQCDTCGKAFKRPEYLASHAIAHTEERPYECDTCSKTYRFENSLRRHKREGCPSKKAETTSN